MYTVIVIDKIVIAIDCMTNKGDFINIDIDNIDIAIEYTESNIIIESYRALWKVNHILIQLSIAWLSITKLSIAWLSITHLSIKCLKYERYSCHSFISITRLSITVLLVT